MGHITPLFFFQLYDVDSQRWNKGAYIKPKPRQSYAYVMRFSWIKQASILKHDQKGNWHVWKYLRNSYLDVCSRRF